MRHNTLRIYMVLVGLLIVVCCHAQMSLEDKSASSATESETEASAAWSDLMPLEVIPDNGQYTDMKVQLTMKQVKAFVKNLHKIRNKAK